MKWLKEFFNKIKKYSADPCKDPRCKGCSHIDGPICPYPNECSTMNFAKHILPELQKANKEEKK